MTQNTKLVDIEIEQGDTWRRAIDVAIAGDALDLTDYDVRMQIRPQYADYTETILLDATIANDRIIIHDQQTETGRFTVEFDAATTQDLQIDSKAFYDIKLESPAGTVIRLLAGRVNVFREVTR